MATNIFLENNLLFPNFRNSSVSTIIVKSPNEKSNFPLMIWVSEMLRSNCVLEVRKQIKKGDHECSSRSFLLEQDRNKSSKTDEQKPQFKKYLFKKNT